MLRPLLLVAAVAAGAALIWVALRPATSGQRQSSNLEHAQSKPAISAAPDRERGTPTHERPLAPRPLAPIASEAAPTAAAATTEPEDGSTVRVVIRTKPDGARFFLDGKRVGKAPFTVDLPKGKVQRYSVWLEGYGARAVVVDGSDRDILLGLVREAPDATPAR